MPQTAVHKARPPKTSAVRVLYKSVSWMHSQKGLRGGWYAVDRFKMEVTGTQYEGARLQVVLVLKRTFKPLTDPLEFLMICSHDSKRGRVDVCRKQCV